MSPAAAASLEVFASHWFELIGVVALEAGIVGLALVLLARIGRRLPSSVLYAVMLVALAKFLLPPVTAPWSPSLALPDIGIHALVTASSSGSAGADVASDPGGREDAADEVRVASPDAAASPRIDAVENQRRPVPTTASVSEPGPATASNPDPVAGQGASSSSTGIGLPIPTAGSDRVFVALLIVQLLGALWLLQRRAHQHLRLARIVRRCHEVRDPAVLDALRAACREQGLRRVPMLLASPDGFGPAAAGLWQRKIFLPTVVLEHVSVRELRPILAHEVAHHRRGGLWVDTTLFLGSLIWWAHPVYGLVGRELRRCREGWCDAAALPHASSPGAYCQHLLDIAALVGRRRHPVAAVAPGGLSHPLGRRIRNIMDGRVQKTRFPLAWVLLILLLTVVATPTFTAYGSWVVESSLGLQNVSFSVRNGTIDLSPGAIDALVERGLDREFVERLDGTEDRDLAIADLRSWVASGFDAALVDELAAFGIESLTTMDALRLAWAEVTAPYVASLRRIGFTGIDAGDISRLARYGVAAQYIADFRAQGYDELDVDDLVRLRRYDVEPEYAGAYAAAGYDLSVDDLVRLNRYEVAPEYASTYRTAGYELSVDDLVRLNRYEVDEDAVAQLSEAGVQSFSVDELVRLERYGVTQEYIRAVTEDGAQTVSVDDLVTLNRHEVTPEYLLQLRAADDEIGVDDIVLLKRYGVDSGLLHRLEDRGHGDVGTDDLIRLHRYNVDLAYIAGLEAMGHEGLSVDDLVTLQRYEVDVALLTALAETGYAELPVSDVVKLHRYGIDAATLRALSAASARRLSVDELASLKRYEVEPAYLAGLVAVGFGALETSEIVQLKRYEVEPSFIERLQAAGFEDLTVDKIIRMWRASR